MMTKINKFSIIIFLLAFLLPYFAFAQTAAPGSSQSANQEASKGTSALDVLNQAQQDEKNRIENAYGTDTGDNYNALDAAGDAIKDAAGDVADSAKETADAIKKGNIGGAIWGALKTGANFSYAGFKAAWNFF